MTISKIKTNSLSDSLSLPGTTTTANVSYTGTLTGGTGVVNLGSGQFYKDASGNVGIGTSSPNLTSFQQAVTLGNGTGSGVRHAYEINGSQSVAENSVGDFNVYNKGSLVSRLLTVRGSADNSGILTFFTSNAGTSAERMRIDSSGNLLVGTTSTASSSVGFRTVVNAGYVSTTTSGNFNICNTASASGTETLIQFQYSNVAKGGISCNGTLVAYNTSSDYRLKENITPMTGALAKVALLKPCTYTWKVDGSGGQGFIAHELAEVEPGCVTGEKDAVDAEGNPQYQGIDTSFLVATLTAAIQELKVIIDAQAQTIESLTDRVSALEQN